MENLIVQTAFVGDLFLTIPTMKQIKRLSPDEKLSLYCRKGLGEVFLKLGLIDEFIEVDKADKTTYGEAAKYLREKEWSRIFCLHRSVRSALLVKSLRAEEKIGYKTWWSRWFFDRSVERPMHLPEVLRQMVFFVDYFSEIREAIEQYDHNQTMDSDLGQDTVDYRVQPSIPSWASMVVKDRLPVAQPALANDKTVLVAPGSVWNTKRWTESGFVGLCKALRDRGYGVSLIGSPAERPLCERIAANLNGATVYAGKLSLWETMLAIHQGRVLVSNDSGAMHMASAMGTPVLSIFGPTTLEIGYRPWNDKAIVMQRPLPCRPCGKHGHDQCPIGTHECMNSILAVDVLNQLNQLLKP